ncbi:hypothetical protein VJ918_02270 [Adlercreutzia sp. R21]|uniref:hypothetical protein n=1 Tax=Adlercreutzia wanghongyangiae TaxID=3111451 RepID=UPI002DBB9637|nr:hypothetical protein [Adlercreutzia sp. R21]MEC4183625.1 hypothetical protein [Adlercreutzia sp. R21]
MNTGTLVFRDDTTAIDDLIVRVRENPLRMALADVTVEEPGHAIEGENWRPQLAPYKPWVHDAALDETEQLAGTDGDLLIVGALGMGISDEERMALIGDAVHGGMGTGEAVHGSVGSQGEPARTLTPHELWTLGQTPRWTPPAEGEADQCCEASENRETPESIRETSDTDRETILHSRETMEEAGGASDELCHFATNVPLTVRRDGDGFAVSAMHLSVLAEHGLPADNLVVVVPSSIDGVPVTRIASEAFARRFTSGAHVRLLVVPDAVEVVGAQAFGSVCAEAVYLGAGVRTYDPAPLDLALPNPRLEARRYLVSAANERLAVQDGCLLEKMGDANAEGRADCDAATERGPNDFHVGEGAGAPTGGPVRPNGPWRLLFVEAPYEEQRAIPEGVRVMGPAVFAEGCPPPRVLDAPDSLTRVDGTVHPETIWRGSDRGALARIVQRCGGRVTDFQAVEEDQCWYDFADGEARLVAGPPAPDSVSRRFSSAAHARVRKGAALSPREIAAEAAAAMVAPVPVTDRLALPRMVQGVPLTTIADRALITAPATLALPDTVRTVRDGNACKGTRKLMLPAGLQSIGAHCFCSRNLVGPVLIPASVASIGEGSFEYAVVRLEAADAVVHITSDQLISCFTEEAIDGVPFDFARYDDQLLAGRGLPDHLGALLHRVAAPFRLAPEMRARIVDALHERAADAVAYVAREGDIAMVRALAEAGFLDDAALFDRQIERLRASNRTDCVLFLMNWQHDRTQTARATTPQRARDRFAL